MENGQQPQLGRFNDGTSVMQKGAFKMLPKFKIIFGVPLILLSWQNEPMPNDLFNLRLAIRSDVSTNLTQLEG